MNQTALMANTGDQQMLVYCSGSHYSPEEIAGMLEISAALEQNGYKTYLPSRDGVEFLTSKLGADPELDRDQLFEILNVLNKVTFALDIYQVVRRCDALVLNMNGRTPEEGSVFKTSLAYSTGKPLVLYKNDDRSAFYGRDNTMLTGLSGDFTVIRKLPQLSKALSRAIIKAPPNSYNKDKGLHHPPFVRQALTLGEMVWDVWRKMNFSQLDETGLREQVLDFKARCEDLLEKVPIEI